MKRRILLVTHWFYPRQNPRAFRAYELYRELLKNNSVDLLIGDYHTFLNENDDYENILKKYENSSKAFVHKLSNKRVIQVFKRAIEYFIGERYLLTSGKYIRKNILLEKYDAVISIGLPFYTHWIVGKEVRRYKKKEDIVAISDWGDPFFGWTRKKIAPYFDKIQKKTCNSFDYIVTPTETAVDYFKNYVSYDKIKVIPQGINIQEIKVASYEKTNVPKFAYAGIFYEDIRNPKKLFEVLETIDEDFVFTIYTIKHGPLYVNIIQHYEKVLKNKLVVKDIIPRLECIYELSKNDFLINIENMTTNQIPSKLIDYTISGRPILSFKQNEVPIDKLFCFLHGDYSSALRLDISQHDSQKVAKKFEDLISEKGRAYGNI